MADWRAAQRLESAQALPAEVYLDPALAAAERAQVFARSWQLVGRASALANPGDLGCADAAGVPLLLIRDGHSLRALHNVCRHRAGPLATGPAQGQTQLRCRYHGWTYQLDGRLRSGPELEAIGGLDRESVRLPAAAVHEWQGLIWAAIDAAPDFAEVCAGIDARVAPFALADYVFERRVVYEAACNWKLYVENYLEGYHVPHIHPALNRLLDYREYRTECARWHSLQWSPLDNGASFYGAGEALYYFIWPNTMLNILPGRLQSNRILPLGADRCRIEFDYYYAAPVRAGMPERIAEDQRLADLVQAEDIEICEQLQRALASGSYQSGRIHPTRESGVHHFQELYRQAMR